MTDETKGLFEKHLQTGLLGVLGILVIWFGRTTLETKEQVIVLTTTVASMRENVSARMLDRYTGTQAKAHQRYEQLQIQNILKRLEHHEHESVLFEKRLDVLEKPGSDLK